MCILVLLFVGCSVSESGDVEVFVCPNCSGSYDGFVTCAFYSSDWPKPGFVLDADNYAGVGIPVSTRGYMHHKFCFNNSHAVFGSANPTVRGLELNNNLVVRVESAVMADNFRSEYDFLRGVGDGKYAQSWEFNGRKITQLFCPRSSCEDHILDVLSSAKQSIVFLAFSFTSEPITELLINKHVEGVCVSGVVENRAATAFYASYPVFREQGMAVFRAQVPGVMHHKAFLVDNHTAIIGSYNPSQNANTNNAETVVILQEPAVIQALNEEYSKLLGFFACT